MDENKEGVESSDEELETPAEGSEGESKEDITPTEGQESPAAGDDSTNKRINDLMSKWQSSDARAQKLEQELERIKGQQPSPETKSRFDDPNYKPKTYKEFYQDVRAETKTEEAREAERQIQIQEQIKQDVDNFITEVKKQNPNFNEKEFNNYAIRPGFRIDTLEDLRGVYDRYMELQEAKKLGEESGRKGRMERGDKVETGGPGKSGVDFSDIRTSRGGILDGAMEAFSRLTK